MPFENKLVISIWMKFVRSVRIWDIFNSQLLNNYHFRVNKVPPSDEISTVCENYEYSFCCCFLFFLKANWIGEIPISVTLKSLLTLFHFFGRHYKKLNNFSNWSLNWIVLQKGWLTKPVNPYFQLGPLLEGSYHWTPLAHRIEQGKNLHIIWIQAFFEWSFAVVIQRRFFYLILP